MSRKCHANGLGVARRFKRHEAAAGVRLARFAHRANRKRHRYDLPDDVPRRRCCRRARHQHRANAVDISGAGATFPYPIYAKWADTYKKETGNGLNYQSIGSGGGIKQIKAKTVTFGATDAPLKADELKAAGLVQWPMVMGGIVPVVNLEA